MAATFFSPQWCAQALVAEHAASPEITSLFQDASAFTHVLALEVSDRPDLVTHLRYEQGTCVAWTADRYPEDEVWIRFSATLEHWQQAASGSVAASKLVMTGRMKLTRGALKDVIANQAAFDHIVQCFSTIDTTWQI